MNNFTYFRKYIIFKADYLNIPGINPKGHGKVEVKGSKGNISVSIENGEIEKDYIISFLKESNGQLLAYNVGRIITDHRGRGKADIPINLKDLESQGFSIEEINAILIGKDNDILLGGYMGKDEDIIDRFIEKLMPKEAMEETTIEAIEYDIIEENIVEEIDTSIIEPDLGPVELDYFSKEETVERETTFEIEEALIEKETPVVENIPVVEEIPNLDNIFIEGENSIAEEIFPEGIPVAETSIEENETIGYNSYEENKVDDYEALEYIRRLNHKNQMVSYILNILRFFPQVEPFKLNLQGYDFWQIDDNGIDSYQGFLPYFNYLMSVDYKYPFLGNSTTCINQIKKHGHYLFGLYKENEDTKYYIYAVPGEFTIEEHPFRGITGFNTWYEAIDSLGYWLLYIDPMTGEIIYPLNPMIPAY